MSSNKTQNFNSKSPQIGEIYLVNFDGEDSEQRGLRPGLVFQNNSGNIHSPNIVVLPLTSSIKKMNMPTHVFLPSQDTGLRKDSVVLCENPVCISQHKLGRYLTSVPQRYMSDIVQANLLASSAISFLDFRTLWAVWQRAISLNAAV